MKISKEEKDFPAYDVSLINGLIILNQYSWPKQHKEDG